MHSYNRNNSPCTECRRRSLRCDFKVSASACTGCMRRGLPCSGPSRQNERVAACTRCHRLKRPCHRLAGNQSCTRCITAVLPCRVPDYLKVIKVSRGLHVLQQKFLSYALSYHLIELFVKLTGGGIVTFGVTDANVPIETSVANCRGKLSELSGEDELLALVCMNEVVSITEHTSVIRDASRRRTPNAALGYARRDAITVLENQISTRFCQLLEVELRREGAFDTNLAQLFRLCLGTLSNSAIERLLSCSVEPLLTLQVQDRLVVLFVSGGVDRTVAYLFWSIMCQFASLDLRQGPLARYLVRLYCKPDDFDSLPTSSNPFPGLSDCQVSQILSGETMHVDYIWRLPFAALRRVRNRNFILAAHPSASRFSEAKRLLYGAQVTFSRSVDQIASHPHLYQSLEKVESAMGPHRFIAHVVISSKFIFDLYSDCINILALPKNLLFQPPWLDSFATGVANMLTEFADWTCILYDLREHFTKWEIHERFHQDWLGIMASLFGKPTCIFENWASDNLVLAERLLPMLDLVATARWEAADIACFIREAASRRHRMAMGILDATLTELDATEASVDLAKVAVSQALDRV